MVDLPACHALLNYNFQAWFSVAVILMISLVTSQSQAGGCHDSRSNCAELSKSDIQFCKQPGRTSLQCNRTCNMCNKIALLPQFDLANLPKDLTPISFLVGQWESGGSRDVIRNITGFPLAHGIQFGISKKPVFGAPTLNYSSYAVDKDNQVISENGFIMIKNKTSWLALVTVSNLGLTSIEEGRLDAEHNVIFLQVRSFGGHKMFNKRKPQIPHTKITRVFLQINNATLEQRLFYDDISEYGSQIYTKVQ